MHTLTQTISVGESGTLVAISFMNVLLIRCRVTRDNTCRTGPVDDGLVKDCGEIIQATGYLCAKKLLRVFYVVLHVLNFDFFFTTVPALKVNEVNPHPFTIMRLQYTAVHYS